MNIVERFRIELNTGEDIKKLHSIACSLDDQKIMIESGDGYCINAKSMLGLMATIDFSRLYIVSDKPIYHFIKDFVV